jgi:hypothetical protein
VDLPKEIKFSSSGSGPAIGTEQHPFLVELLPDPLVRSVAFAAQQQIATFFDSGGAVTIDPDSLPGPLFPV